MAVDTATKRYAMMGLCAPHRFVAPVPDGTIGAADRQQFLYGYPGILWGAAVAPAAFGRRFTATGRATAGGSATGRASAGFTIEGDDGSDP
jgi:hypothetical protein